MRLKSNSSVTAFQSCVAKIRSTWSAMNNQLYHVKSFNMWLTLFVDLLNEPKMSARIVKFEKSQRKIGWKVLKNSSIGEYYILESDIAKFSSEISNQLRQILLGFESSRLPILFTDLGDGGNRTLIISLDIIPGQNNSFEKAMRFATAKQTTILN